MRLKQSSVRVFNAKGCQEVPRMLVYSRSVHITIYCKASEQGSDEYRSSQHRHSVSNSLLGLAYGVRTHAEE